MRVFVTGAGGFCGAWVTAHLLRKGHTVIAAVGTRGNGRLDAVLRSAGIVSAPTIIGGDLADGGDWPVDVDAIVHTAARLPDPGVTVGDLVRANVIATERLVGHARRNGIRTFLYFSSLSIYGRIDASVVDETTAIKDPDPYGETKHVGETLVAGGGGGFRSASFRLPGVVGPESGRNWLSSVLRKAMAGEKIAIFSPDAPFNNAVHVEDLARFSERLLAAEWSGSHAMTLGAGGMTTISGAVHRIVERLPSSSTIFVEAAAKPSFTVSSDFAKKYFLYDPMPIDEMLDRFVDDNTN